MLCDTKFLSIYLSPSSGEFTGEGFVKDGGFTGFKAVQCILCLLFGLIQFSKQAFNAVNNALLFCKGRNRDRVSSDIIHADTLLTNSSAVCCNTATNKLLLRYKPECIFLIHV